MARLPLVAAALLTLVALCSMNRPAAGQQFSFRSGPQAVQSLSVGYYVIDFEFDGEETPPFSFNFDQPAYGLVYSRPHFLVTFALGDQEAGGNREALRLLDLSLTTWAELLLSSLGSGSTHVYVPVALYSNYRRVSPRGDQDSVLEAFNVTVLGLGAGLGLERAFGERTFFTARANPVIGLATSSLTDAFGSAYVIDADVQLHLAELFGRLGLSFGYTFRRQVWNVNVSDIFPDATEDLFDYQGQQHLFRMGLNW